MKCAIIHDSLLEFGGAERVLQSLLKMYPNADLYTSFADNSILNMFFSNFPRNRIHTFPFPFLSRSKTSIIQMISPFIWKQYSFEKYDIVISSSSALFSNSIKVVRPKHIQYIHSIPKNIFGLSPQKRLQKYIPYTNYLRKFYISSTQGNTNIVANSCYTQQILFKKCLVQSTVIYPPVRIPKNIIIKSIPKYFLIVSRLDRTKGLELAIHAATKMKIFLKIAGKGIDKAYLKELYQYTNKYVEFIGFVPESDLGKLYSSSYAFIMTAKNEDFGIAPIEAMAHGIPVIAHYSGGLKETIIPSKTGVFFYEYSTKALSHAINILLKTSFDHNTLYRYSKKFGYNTFSRKLFHFIGY